MLVPWVAVWRAEEEGEKEDEEAEEGRLELSISIFTMPLLNELGLRVVNSSLFSEIFEKWIDASAFTARGKGKLTEAEEEEEVDEEEVDVWLSARRESRGETEGNPEGEAVKLAPGMLFAFPFRRGESRAAIREGRDWEREIGSELVVAIGSDFAKRS